MRALTQALFAIFCATLFCLPLAAQQQQTGAFGNPGGAAQSLEAKGSIQGKVIQDPGGQPIRKVRISLRGPMQYSAITDEAGQFKIENVQPGMYFAQLEKPGFTEPRKTIRERQIKVAAGQDTNDVVFYMLAAGVISGRIVDSDGDPVASLGVIAILATGKSSPPEIRQQRSATNDVGEYRIHDLPPGKYYLEAIPDQRQAPLTTQGANSSTKERSVFARTFFPGTIDKQQASVIAVSGGSSATASFGLLTTRVYHVTGTVEGVRDLIPQNTDVATALELLRQKSTQIVLVGSNGYSEQQGLIGDGNFDFPSVPAGSYHAVLTVVSGVLNGQPPSVRAQRVRGSIEVNGDVSGLQLQVDTAGDVTGRFRSEDDEKIQWKDLHVSLLAVSNPGDEPELAAGTSSAHSGVQEDCSFEIKDVPTETYQLVVSAHDDKFRDYYTKSVLLAGREVADSGFPVGSSTLLDVLISSKGASIDGTVLDADGKPASAASVVTIPSSGKLGRPDTSQIGQTDEAGHFSLRGINPGDFTVLAFDEMQPDYRSPEFAKKYESKGEKVQLEESQKKTVTLKLITDDAR